MPKSERTRGQKAVEVDIMQRLLGIPDTRTWAVNGRNERQLAYNLVSIDGDALREAAASDRKRSCGTVPVLQRARRRKPRSSVRKSASRPRFDAAARLGVSTDQISETIRVATIGDVDFNLAKFNAGDRLVPIRVQLKEEMREDMQAHQAAAHHEHRRHARYR